MSNPYLPPEILDYIVDFLHDDPDALERCCLTSKSWIPRTRKHLFAEVDLWHEDRLGSWKKMFSDPSTSPAHFVRSLRIGGACAVTTADAEVGGWLRGFAHIVHLGVETSEFYHGGFPVSLVPFHGFSRTIKSLRVKSVDLPPSEIFDFILSSPLLEDLAVAGWRTWACDMDGSDGPPTFVQPSNPPAFTGSLELPSLQRGMQPIASRFLSVPGGIHFRKLTLTWSYGEDLLLIMALVRECSHTLESLNITCNVPGELEPTSVDLSTATRLNDMTFRIDSLDPKWVTITLRTITSKHRDLRQILISAAYFSKLIGFHIDFDVRVAERQTAGQWLELDRLLAQLWESHSTPPKIMCRALSGKEKDIRDLMGRLLPEVTVGGTANLLTSSGGGLEECRVEVEEGGLCENIWGVSEVLSSVDLTGHRDGPLPPGVPLTGVMTSPP